MDVLVDTAIGSTWEIIVDNVHDMSDIEPTSRNASGHQNWSFCGTESPPKNIKLVEYAKVEKGMTLTMRPLAHAGCGQNE